MAEDFSKANKRITAQEVIIKDLWDDLSQTHSVISLLVSQLKLVVDVSDQAWSHGCIEGLE